MLAAQRLHYTRGRRQILCGVDLQVAPGTFTALLGPNGAGKSTLMRLLTGEAAPDAGVVSLDGRALGGYRPAELAQRRAVLSQQLQVNFPYTVREVVEMAGYALPPERRPHPATLRMLLDALNVAHLADRTYATLSGGEQQRVQLARVIAQIWEGPPHTPRYLLLDEPTASQDLAQQHAVFALLRALLSRGIGIFAIVHDLNIAAQYADHLVFLRAGCCLASGETRATLTEANVEATFAQKVRIADHPELGCPLVISCPVHQSASRLQALLDAPLATASPPPIPTAST